jgi:glycine C-acetyltransferase
MLRLIPTAMHSLADVEVTLKAFEQVAYKLENKLYAQEIYDIHA